MTFNADAVPVAIAFVVVGLCVWLFRGRLARASERQEGLPEGARRRWEPWAAVGSGLSVVLAVVVLVAPFGDDATSDGAPPWWVLVVGGVVLLAIAPFAYRQFLRRMQRGRSRDDVERPRL